VTVYDFALKYLGYESLRHVQNPGITAGEILFVNIIGSALQTSPGSIVESTSF